MKRFALIAVLLIFAIAADVFSTPAYASSVTTTKQFSVGFFLDNNDCDFGERFNMPDEISAIFTLKTTVKKVKIKGRITSKTTYRIYRSGKFPFQTILTKIKVTRKGFTATGSRVMRDRGFSEKISLSAGRNSGEATLTMNVVEAGTRCQYSYFGEAITL